MGPYKRESITSPVVWSVGLLAVAGYGVYTLSAGTELAWQWGAIVGISLALTFTEWITWGYRGIIERYSRVLNQIVGEDDE